MPHRRSLINLTKFVAISPGWIRHKHQLHCRKTNWLEVCCMVQWNTVLYTDMVGLMPRITDRPTYLPRYKLVTRYCLMGAFTPWLYTHLKILTATVDQVVLQFCAVQWLMFRRFGGPHGLRFHVKFVWVLEYSSASIPTRSQINSITWKMQTIH
jgi:hypothetical protein